MRDANTAADGAGLTLGQILLQKANQGVRVLILECAHHHLGFLSSPTEREAARLILTPCH